MALIFGLLLACLLGVALLVWGLATEYEPRHRAP